MESIGRNTKQTLRGVNVSENNVGAGRNIANRAELLCDTGQLIGQSPTLSSGKRVNWGCCCCGAAPGPGPSGPAQLEPCAPLTRCLRPLNGTEMHA